MKIHEYQAQQLFSDYAIPNTVNYVVMSTDLSKIPEYLESLGDNVVVKAQVLIGGRGKAGGVKIAKNREEALCHIQDIFDIKIKGVPVEKIMLAEAIHIKKEFYMGLVLDRAQKGVVLILSAAGGVEIEELAKHEPEKIKKLFIHPTRGFQEKDLDELLGAVFTHTACAEQAKKIFSSLYELFQEKDCTLAEINPLALTEDGKLVAVDAKINFDDNALYKHEDIVALKNPEEYTHDEINAQEAGLSFVSMEGNIGCIVNGAGLAMATMDIIKLYGGQPANFLDVGGSSNPAKVLNALKIILSNKDVKAILINIFGGITRCDDIAKGILQATKEIKIPHPLVIRLIGTNQEEGRALLVNNGFEVFSEMNDAVESVVNQAGVS